MAKKTEPFKLKVEQELELELEWVINWVCEFSFKERVKNANCREFVS